MDNIETFFVDKENSKLGLFINNQYVTVKQIGVGGFGTVWLAYDFSLRNFVAIKELIPEYSQSRFVEMFYKEALIAKNIIHDNIVRVQHFWRGSNGSYYVVLDYVYGVDLEKLIKKCNDINVKVPWKIATFICMCVLKAIDYANRIARDTVTGKSYGIVYRDISPSNVLLSFNGNVKLSDFGIAKTVDEVRDSIPEHIIIGKYSYMSPEQIQGFPDIDHRTDIFSIAVLYYEMLTGQQLYKGSKQEIKEQILNKNFNEKAFELEVGVDVPCEVGAVITKALEKNREDRYEKAVEMYRDIRRLLKGIDTEELLFVLSKFINTIMKEEFIKAEDFMVKVRNLDIQEIQKNNSILKITCQDFIVGQNNDYFFDKKEVPYVKKDLLHDKQLQKNTEKGKTIFEDVGNWLVTKLNNTKKNINTFLFSVILAFFIFVVLDIFLLQLTSFGETIYTKLYPPDVVINTVPAGAVINMVSKDGEKVLLKNVSTASPIHINKVIPGVYIVTALKEGFKPVRRVIKIEKYKNTKKVRKEKIELFFDFVLNIDSNPRDVDVFIDGNRLGKTPCNVQLLAGAHTVKLSSKNFEDLGSSSAGYTEQGKCNIDFAKATVEEMFSDVDRKYWNCELKNINGENIFCLKGSLFKKMNIDSAPQGVLFYVEGENKPRGKTPLKTLFKIGKYKVRLVDTSARYEEALKEIEVSKDSDVSMFVKMNKIVSFRVLSKNELNDTFVTYVSIFNKYFNIKRKISTDKPIKIALPVDTYDIAFVGNNKYKTHNIHNLNIEKTDIVVGRLEYSKVLLTLNVISEIDGNCIERAFVWLNNKNIGKTDGKGSFKYQFYPGKYEFKVVAKDHKEQTIAVNLLPGKNSSVDIIMTSNIIKEQNKSNNFYENIPSAPIDERYSNDDAVYDIKKNMDIEKNEKNRKKDNENVYEEVENREDNSTKKQIVVCLNCGYVNTVPVGKKIRFCLNCAKTLN